MTATTPTVNPATVARTLAVYRARARLAAATLHLDDLTGHLTPDQRTRHDHDLATFTTAARQLETHLDER